MAIIYTICYHAHKLKIYARNSSRQLKYDITEMHKSCAITVDLSLTFVGNCFIATSEKIKSQFNPTSLFPQNIWQQYKFAHKYQNTVSMIHLSYSTFRAKYCYLEENSIRHCFNVTHIYVMQ